jgi:hypothetical protein
MDLFGMKFSFALGAWRLRFVLMLEDAEAAGMQPKPAPAQRSVTLQSMLN